MEWLFVHCFPGRIWNLKVWFLRTEESGEGREKASGQGNEMEPTQ